MMAFVVSAPVARRAKPLSLGRCHRPKKSDQIATSVSMQLTLGKTSLYTGIGILAGVLTNRLLLTPLDSLAMTQSRSDILGVITGATLILYGVGKAEIADAKKAVEMGGEFIRQGFTPDDTLSGEVEWAASATFAGVPNIRSFCVIANGVGQFFIGQFRDEEVAAVMVEGGTIDNSIASGKRAYLADMKTVPTKELEFGFLPSNCQAVIIQPVTDRVAIILGADKPRPFTGKDFGWLQAISDRLSGILKNGAGTQEREDKS